MNARRKVAWLGWVLLIAVAGSMFMLREDEIIGDGGPMEFSVMSFNIRQGRADVGENAWSVRQSSMARLIAREQPDVLGVQEALRFQLDDLQDLLSGFVEVGCGRDGDEHGEYAAILIRKRRFKVLATDTFWLSDTPSVPSAHWGNEHYRICTWARLQDRQSGRCVYVYNTHLDHQSQVARERAVQLIMQMIAARQFVDPYVLMGDFNAGESNRVIAYIKGRASLEKENPLALDDSWRRMHPDERESGTINRFTGSREPFKLDYIFVPPKARVLAAEILRDQPKGRYISDHYPVTARLRFE